MKIENRCGVVFFWWNCCICNKNIQWCGNLLPAHTRPFLENFKYSYCWLWKKKESCWIYVDMDKLTCFAGFLCNCVLPVTLNSTKVRHHRMEEKPCEGEKEALASEGKKSNSSPSPARGRRGRSRTRRSLPPPSPLIVGSSSWSSSWMPKIFFSFFSFLIWPITVKLLDRRKATDWILSLKLFFFILYIQ